MTEPDGPLLIIINEAKTVPDEIFDALGRCNYNLLIEIGTGGPMRGRFYEHFTKSRSLYKTYAVTWDDCPHLPQEKKQQIIAEFGENHPYTRSTIYGEFMATDDTISHIFELPDIESNRAASIPKLPGSGQPVVGIDFGAGIDANTFVKRIGNYVEVDGIQGWPERDTNAACNRFLALFRRHNIEARHIWGDADGIGLAMINDLAAVGWRVNHFHGGAKSPDPAYKNLITYCWHQVAAKVRRHEIIVPDHQQLIT